MEAALVGPSTVRTAEGGRSWTLRASPLARWLARDRGRRGLGLRLRVLRKERSNALVEVLHDEVLGAERLEHLLRRVDRVAGDLHHDRRGVRLQRLAELLELLVLEAGIAQLGDEGADRPAGQDPDRPADDADRTAQ